MTTRRITRTRPSQVPASSSLNSGTDRIYELLETIKTTPGKKAKVELLKVLRHHNPELTARIMRAVFDVNVTYGIKKVPAPGRRLGVTLGPREFTAVTWAILSDLASRRLTGNAALDVLSEELGSLTLKSRALLTAILQQNLRAGFSADVVNQVWGNIIKVTKVQLANEFYERLEMGAVEFPGRVETKYDGVRAFRLTSENTYCFSRKGLPVEIPAGLEQVLRDFMEDVSHKFWNDEPILLDCEIVAREGGFREVSSNTRSTKKGAVEGSVGIRIIDIITEAEYALGQSDDGYEIRRKDLEQMVTLAWFEPYAAYIQLTESEPVTCVAEVEAYFARKLAEGLEGGMYKRANGLWQGKRSDDWLKLKDKNRTAGTIIGYKPGEKGSKWAGHLGSLQVSLESGVTVYVAGMTDAMRQELFDNIDVLVAQEAEVEIKFHEYTPDGSLRHPRIHELRDDK